MADATESSRMAALRQDLFAGVFRTLRIPALAALLHLGPPVHGAPPEPAPNGRYRVTGIAAGDRLNIRTHPGATSEIAGHIAPDVDGIMVSGVSEKIDNDIWWQLIPSPANPASGWVNSRYLTLTAAEDENNYPLLCYGTEPFWSLDIAGANAKFDPGGGDKTDWTASEWIAPRGGTYGTFAVRVNEGDARGYAAIKQDPACSDGMSERLYPFFVLLIDPAGAVFTGCCARR